MSRRNLADEWRLEEQDVPADQWKLEPAEQNAIAQWQLRDEAGGVDPNEWQPVSYTRERREPRVNWVLPSLVGIALVAVIAYVAWIALERAGLFGPVAPAPTPTSAAAVATEPGEAPGPAHTDAGAAAHTDARTDGDATAVGESGEHCGDRPWRCQRTQRAEPTG